MLFECNFKHGPHLIIGSIPDIKCCRKKNNTLSCIYSYLILQISISVCVCVCVCAHAHINETEREMVFYTENKISESSSNSGK